MVHHFRVCSSSEWFFIFKKSLTYAVVAVLQKWMKIHVLWCKLSRCRKALEDSAASVSVLHCSEVYLGNCKV